MHIRSLAVSRPSRRFTNEELLAQLDATMQAEGFSPKERVALAARLRRLFTRAGSETRALAYPPPPGHAAALLAEAAATALARAGLRADALDLIVYCSVARGWLEPSSAAGAQALIGAGNASCFDVLEACAGWMRAVEVTSALLASGRYRTAMILGVEAGMLNALLPRPGQPIGEEHLAGFTLGEAASAMVVTAGGEAPEIVLRSDGSQLETCMIPLGGIGAFLPAGRVAPEPGRFLSHAETLFTRVITALVEVMRPRLARLAPGEVELFIPHAASQRAGEVVRRALGIARPAWLCGHASFGNTVAMSMPVALDHAYATGRAKPGARACFLVASAGITYGYGMLTV